MVPTPKHAGVHVPRARAPPRSRRARGTRRGRKRHAPHDARDGVRKVERKAARDEQEVGYILCAPRGLLLPDLALGLLRRLKHKSHLRAGA